MRRIIAIPATPDMPVQAHQREFLDLALASQALRLGEFTLKSGRASPYFFNAGRFDSGKALQIVGNAYAASIIAAQIGFDMLFGPAYKGIALATATALALAREHRRDVPLAFNRKEAKDHGEGGWLIGAALSGRVLIVDDVISAGTATRESIEMISAAGAQLAGVAVALDRQERGRGTRSAAHEIAEEFSVPVIAIARLDDLLSLAAERPELAAHATRLQAYRDAFGA